MMQSPHVQSAHKFRIDPMLRSLLLLAAALCLAGAVFSAEAALGVEREALRRALRATVLVLTPNDAGAIDRTGSGTVLDPDKGYILTNFHVMADPETGAWVNREGTAAIGVITEDIRSAPVLRYKARMVNYDVRYDLALLQIVGYLDDDNAGLPANLGLTTVPRGNSDDLLPGDRLAVIGYPGLGGVTVTYTEGVVAGFLDEDNDGEFEWIKTDAQVNPGNSGGLAIDSAGNFIGVPTSGYSRADVAGKISLVRPASIALRFYDNAVLGQGGRSGGGSPGAALSGNREAAIAAVEFGAAINRQSKVTQPLTVFPSGSTDIYVSFEFNGFRNGQRFSYVWKLDGETVYSDAFVWQEGASGTSWLHLYSTEGLPDGVYTVEMRLDGVLLHAASVTVGARSTGAADASFGAITFAAGVTDDLEPIRPGDSFVDVKTVYAIFSVENMRKGALWRTRWLYEGDEVLSEKDVWSASDVRKTWVSLTHPDGLPVGRYSLELYIGERLAQRGDFTIAARTPERSGRTVSVVGVVRDINNSRLPVVGALVVLLKPGVRAQEWIDSDFDAGLIYATGTSGRRGAYRLNARVTPGASHALVVVHEEYQPLIVDAYTFPADAGDPYQLDVALRR